MKLTKSQKQEFYEEDYLTIEGAASSMMVETARQAINTEIDKGKQGSVADLNSKPVITSKTSLFM